MLARPANLVDVDEAPEPTPTPRPEVKPATPVWVWVVVSVVAVGGVAAGGYFGVREVTRPVTGTVNASW
ncbi:MAG: hypothetical protein INH41_21890 [Myxococcaceae bacterium]|nr:hypothetical protein [Myxococcaceae bacterium]